MAYYDCASGSVGSDESSSSSFLPCGPVEGSAAAGEEEEESTFDSVMFILNYGIIFLSAITAAVNCLLLYRRRKLYPLYAITIPFALLREIGTFYAVFGAVIPDALGCFWGTITWESDNFPLLAVFIYEEFQLYLKFKQHQQMFSLGQKKQGLKHYKRLSSLTAGVAFVLLCGLIFNTVTLDRFLRLGPARVMELSNADDECWLSNGYGESVGDTIFGVVVTGTILYLAIAMRKVDDAFGWSPRYQRCAVFIGFGIAMWQVAILIEHFDVDPEAVLKMYVVMNWVYAFCMYCCSWILTFSALRHSYVFERHKLLSARGRKGPSSSSLSTAAAAEKRESHTLLVGSNRKKGNNLRSEDEVDPVEGSGGPNLFQLLIPVSSSEELWRALKDERVMGAFHQHLVKEFAVENGFYITTSLLYRQAKTEEERGRWAREVLEAHLYEQSATEVNISDGLRRVKIEEVQKALEGHSFPADLFFAVDEEIAAMLLDPYRRFYHNVKRGEEERVTRERNEEGKKKVGAAAAAAAAAKKGKKKTPVAARIRVKPSIS